MKYQLSLLVAVPLTLALAGSASAQHRGSSSGSRGTSTASARGMSGSPKGTTSRSVGTTSRQTTNGHSSYHMQHGTKFAHGYFYRGRNHSHWSHRYYNSRYGCWTYWDSGCGCYYYWCQPASCFYPVSYCPYSRYCWSESNYCVTSVPVVQTPQVAEPAYPPTVTPSVVQSTVVNVGQPVAVSGPPSMPVVPGGVGGR